MKFIVQMKDPDVLHDAIDEALADLKVEGLSDDELEAVREKRKDSISELTSRWFEYGEYLRVEIDTDAETCTVVKC